MSQKKKEGRFKVLKGMVGLLVALGVVALLVVVTVRFANDGQDKDREELAKEQTSQTASECYTPTQDQPFTTGNPINDLAFSYLLDKYGDDKEVQSLVNDYLTTGGFDTSGKKWTEAFEHANEAKDVQVRIYLKLTPNGTLEHKEKDDTTYVPVVVETGEEVESGTSIVSVAPMGENEEPDTSAITQTVVTTSGDSLVIPTPKGENGDDTEYALVEATPVCE